MEILTDRLLLEVKTAVQRLEPRASITLYGSRSRAQAGPESDWDFLILVDGPVGEQRAAAIRHQLYEIEWTHGEVLNAVVRGREEWESPLYRAMPFRQNVERDGILL